MSLLHEEHCTKQDIQMFKLLGMIHLSAAMMIRFIQDLQQKILVVKLFRAQCAAVG